MSGGALGRWALRLVGPVLLAIVLALSDLDLLWGALTHARPAWLVGAAGVWGAIALAKAWRWRNLLAAQGIAIGAGDAVRWYLAGLFLGGVSPGRLGELVKVGFIRELGHSTGRALTSTVLDRLLDVLLLPAMVALGLGLHGGLVDGEVAWLLASAGLTAVGLVLLWRGRRLLAVAVRLLMPPSARAQARVTVDDFMGDMRALPRTVLLSQGALTAACWLAYGFSITLLASALSLPLPPIYVATAGLLAALAGMLPLTVSGIGTRDAVLALFFHRAGLDPAQAIALSTLILALNLAMLALYLPAWLSVGRKPLPPLRDA